MDRFQHYLAWYLGLKTPAPGEGVLWRLDWRSPAPPWVIVIAALGLLIAVTWIYRRDGESLNLRQRLTLTVLRLLVFAVILAMLTELSLTVERTGLPSVAVMIDTSASMSLQDQYPAGSAATNMAKSISLQPGRDAHRLGLTQEVLTRNGGQFLKDLQRNHQVKLYRFSDTATLLDSGNLEATDDARAFESTENETGSTAPSSKPKLPPFQAALVEISSLHADGEQTRPAPSVKKVLADLRGTPPAALILFTDGVASVSEVDKLSTIAESVRRKGTQLHIVGLGSDEASKDVLIYDTLVDEVAFVGDPMSFTAKVKSFGYAGKKLTLRLRKEGEEGVIATQEIKAPPDGQPLKVELSYTSSKPGEFDLILEVVPQSDETNKQNNAEMRHVSVREEKIRVLLVDGVPRYEFRYLKQLFERDKSTELSTLLQDADLEYSQEDRTALEHFPVKKEDLAKFDVIIFGDLNPGVLGPSVLENLRDFVREKGGSIVFIAGPQANPAALNGTPLEAVLPFEPADVRVPAPDAASYDSFHPVLTLEGQKGNSLFRLGDGEADSLRIWNSLPSLYWFVEIPKTKAGVRVFAEHPLKSGSNGRLPIIMLQQVGAGKVLYHATDESWRWRFRRGDLYYGRYWIQAIRYLSRGRLIGKDRTAELSVDQLVYQRGQPVTLRVRFVDEKFLPTDPSGVTVMVERKGEGRQPVKLTRLREAPTMFEGQLARLSDGSYHAWISQPAFNEAPPSTDFRVEAPLRELQRRGMDKADLQLAAKQSNGRLYSLDNVDTLPGEIPLGTPIPLQTDNPIPLWNRWEVLSLFAMLLTTEWMLRKRWRLI
ncbi:MAG: von Willebrand factor type domain protein [Schlesneria sp.]|nr:von Willebrand factor type domain protein [Schlesneria sp.]